MTSRMEFRNYRSSAQLVHCNIHQKRYSDVPKARVKGVTTSTSYEYELRVSENKVQLTRIRDENGKFRSNSVSILNVTFA